MERLNEVKKEMDEQETQESLRLQTRAQVRKEPSTDEETQHRCQRL